eukprot:6200831-Pleurochrysis_carterae.AAC.3
MPHQPHGSTDIEGFLLCDRPDSLVAQKLLLRKNELDEAEDIALLHETGGCRLIVVAATACFEDITELAWAPISSHIGSLAVFLVLSARRIGVAPLLIFPHICQRVQQVAFGRSWFWAPDNVFFCLAHQAVVAAWPAELHLVHHGTTVGRGVAL